MRIAIFAALILAGAVATPALAQLAGNASIGGDSFAVGTLAPLDSFAFEAAPTYSNLALARHRAAVALNHRIISIETAEAIQSHADAVRKLLDRSIAACGTESLDPITHAWRCSLSKPKAERLLAQARAALGAMTKEPNP